MEIACSRQMIGKPALLGLLALFHFSSQSCDIGIISLLISVFLVHRVSTTKDMQTEDAKL